MSDPIEEALRLIDAALSMTNELRGRDQRSQLFDYAEQQLRFMRDILGNGRTPTADEKRAVGVGRMAITYFENGALDQYGTALEEAAGAFLSV